MSPDAKHSNFRFYVVNYKSLEGRKVDNETEKRVAQNNFLSYEFYIRFIHHHLIFIVIHKLKLNY